MSELEQILIDCLALAAQDKITAKNSWSLQLLENIDKLISPTQESCDFVYVSSAISASAKIYAGRVDSLHNMVRHTAAMGCVHGSSQAKSDDPVDQIEKAADKRLKTVKRVLHKNVELTKDFSALQMKPASKDALFRLDPLYSQLCIKELTCTTRSLPVFGFCPQPTSLAISSELSEQILATVQPITSHMVQVAQASLVATPLAAPSASLDRSFITLDPIMQSQYGNFSSRIETAAHPISGSLALSQEIQDNINHYVENNDNLSITEDLIAVSGKNSLWSAAKLPKPPKRQRVTATKRAASTSSKKVKSTNLPRAPRVSSKAKPEQKRKAISENIEAGPSDCSISLDVDEPNFDVHQENEQLSHRSLSITDLDDVVPSVPSTVHNNTESILNIVKSNKLLGFTPTKVNMHHLKDSIQKVVVSETSLTTLATKEYSSNLPLNVDINSTSAVSLIFSALLHLASEGCVSLETQKDDVAIIPLIGDRR